MSIEQAMVARARPYMMAAKARVVVTKEMLKGCLPEISLEPVALEPRFRPFLSLDDILADTDEPIAITEPPPSARDIVRLRLWIGSEQECDWTRSELFVKQLHGLEHRAAFEIIGNEKGITTDLVCHKDDEPVLKAAFRGEFAQCELCSQRGLPLLRHSDRAWQHLLFRDYFPPPPYSHLLTRPSELRISPFEPLMKTLADIPVPALGIYQIVLQPVAPCHDWHRNVQILIDLEYAAKLFGNLQVQQRYAQQAPSGDLRNMAMDVETKSHNDKPFFAVAVRVGLLGSKDDAGLSMLRALSTFMNLFQHGGRPLGYLDERDYRPLLANSQIQGMFLLGTTYRSGFLVNSLELAGLVHVPALAELTNNGLPVEALDGLSEPPDALSIGTHIGTCTHAGRRQRIHIPPSLRMCHAHVIGRPGVGKSSLLEVMSLEEANRGDGVAVLDAHGDLAERVLSLLTESCIDRVVYFEPGNPEWIPLWNPLRIPPDQDASRTADEIVAAIKSISDGWGDRLGTLLRQGIGGLLCVEDATLFDVAMILKATSDKEQRRRILDSTASQLAYEFWRYDVKNYSKVDFGPAQHKLQKLMSSSTVELMFSQSENRIDFRSIMDQSMIFIANLSRVGPESRDVLAKFILSFLHLAALSRSSIAPHLRKPFHVFVDEAHRFVGNVVEDLIAETRKYQMSLTLAHQYLKQFKRETMDALNIMGSIIVFNEQQTDAERMAKVLGERVEVEDLTALGIREAIARIGRDVVRITTPARREIQDVSAREKVIRASRERYCKRASEIREAIHRRRSRPAPSFLGPIQPATAGEFEELLYDEL